MTKRYKSNDGSYLAVVEEASTGNYHIAWFIPDDDGYGAYVGAGFPEDEKVTEDNKNELWEMKTANEVARPFACCKGSYGYEFETEKKAKQALVACNLALSSREVPMPDWALKAAAAGWKPPKGWKP